MLESELLMISLWRLFTPNFPMHKKSEFLSWVVYLSTEVSNGLMFLVHMVKLELIPRIGLKHLR